MHVFEPDIQLFEEADRKTFPAPGGILFAGSATMTIWNATVAGDFAPLPVFGRGFGGSTIADSIHFARRIILPYRPATIVLYAGENDIACGKSAEEVLADFEILATLVQYELPQTRIFFLSIKS